MKIRNDKYYTPPDLANYCWDKVLEVIGEENISEVIEPSVGNGAFLSHPTQMVHFAYDIDPECTSDITTIFKADYLTVDIKYLYGRLVIGNPPYGGCMNMAQKFFKKSIQIADYIAFILPISQLNNTRSMYEFDLIYSEDLGIRQYSDRELHCCFNIYSRPKSGLLNKKPNYKLSDIKIIEYRRDGREINIPSGYDYAMSSFGAGCVGKEIKSQGQYALECYFYIHNEKLKDRVLDILKNTDWKSISKGISGTYRLPQWKICKYLKEKIPELK